METPRSSKKRYTPAQAKEKAESYCAYQERSQQEVRDKLYGWGLHKREVELVLSDLIEENFISESRFALAYASGKFKIKGWGKYKIKEGLKSKQVPDRLIQEALDSIDAEAYFHALEALLIKKARILKDTDPYVREQKLIRHGLMRGYERSLIMDILNDKEL